MRAFRFMMVVAVAPTCCNAQDMPLTQVLIDGEGWQLVGDGYKFTEGPAVDARGNVYFSDVPNNSIYRVDSDGRLSLFTEQAGRTSGLMFGPDGRLYGCRRADKMIVAYRPDGSFETIADVTDCNDLVVTSNGTIYFTEPKAEQVWFIDADRKARIVARGFRPNGIILWTGEGTLVVTDSDQPHLWTFRIEQDGSLAHGERYYMPLQIPSGQTRPGSDGMTVDTDGRLYVATFAGLQMFDPTGRLGGTITKPQNRFLSNVAFGGPDMNYLYATSADKVYRRKVKPTGVRYFVTD